jgi:hypothetical protein
VLDVAELDEPGLPVKTTTFSPVVRFATVDDDPLFCTVVAADTL